MRRLKALAAILFVLTLCVPARGASLIRVRTVDPVLELIVQFIGGPYVETASGWSWDAKDKLRSSRAQLIGGEESELPLLALDRKQYARFMTSTRKGSRGQMNEAEKNRPNVHYLFPDGVVSDGHSLFYGDPANLPYTAQRVMTILSGIAPKRYSYFQRRLGEFDARLRTVLVSARRRLSGAQILCLSDYYSIFFKAAGCKVSRPTESELEQLRMLARPIRIAEDSALTPAKAAARKKAAVQELLGKRLLVMDSRVEPELRSGLAGPNAVYIAPPRKQDFLFFIHSVVLLIGSSLDQLNK